MRLLKLSARGELSLTKDFVEEDIPPYAILSHTWGADNDEVTFSDLENGSGKSKTGYAKIQFCGRQAKKDGLQYFWVDTCCIDKANHTELSEAIISMFGWYRDATKCYVYLSDVSVCTDINEQTEWTSKSPFQNTKRSLKRKARSGDDNNDNNNNDQPERMWESAFRKSRWFTRGWTLQELLAPRSVEFFSWEGELLGDKKLLELQIHEITKIPVSALRGVPLSDFDVDERLRWAENRETKRKEDKAYCLLGIFDVFMPSLYGEGENAFTRLKYQINKHLWSKLDKATMESLDDIHVTDPQRDMERIEDSKDTLLKDCYEWILQDPDLQNWRDGDKTSLLWINGNPGKGKTMLMIALVRELCKKSSAVTFFFCQATDPRLNNAASILRGLIWKLAMDHTKLAKIFHEKFRPGKAMLSGPNVVYNLFSILSAMLDAYPEAFLIIDALDECHPGQARDQLLRLITNHAKSSNAKWLLSSRNYPEIRQILKQESRMLSLELNEQHISEAVHRFVEHKISELAKMKNYSQDLKKQVKEQMLAKANSTFLWVALACKSLLDVSRWQAVSTVEKFPLGLESLYERMMEQVLQSNNKERTDYCLHILRSVSLAFRPLSMEELIIVAELPVRLLNHNDILEIIDFCDSFIIVREDTIYFIHQSAKDYLMGYGTQKLFSAGLQTEHSLIVSRSFNAMSETLGRDMCNLQHPGSTRPATIDTRLKAISYVSCFWMDHLTNSFGDDFSSRLQYEEYLRNGARLHEFLLKHFLHWFEALSLFGEVDRGILGLQSLERMVERLAMQQSENFLLKDFVLDAIRVMRQFRPAVEEAPLQVYYSTLVFSPEQSLVRQNFKQEAAHWITPLPRIAKSWSSCLQTLEGHTDWASSVVFSPSGQQLASCSGDGTVRLWDAATGACLRTLEGHTAWVRWVRFSPNSQQLASCSDDCTARIWDVATGACLQKLEGHVCPVSSVIISPSGQQLASCSDDRTVRLWDVATGACLQTFMGHIDSVNSVVFSPSGQQLASCSRDGTVQLWDIATGAYLQTFEGHTRSVNWVVFSPSGQQLASCAGEPTIRVWDMATGACLRTLEGHAHSVYFVVFSPNGQQLASCSFDCTVRLWDNATGACLQTFEGHTESVQSVVFSPSGQQLASCSVDRTIRLWDVGKGVCLQMFEGHTDSVNSVAFSPNGQQLASCSFDFTLRLWDTAAQARLQKVEGHSDSVYSVVFSPSSQQLASCSRDGTVRLWDVATGACLQTFVGHIRSVNSVVFSPQGQQLASSSGDLTVRLWDLATGICLQTFEGHTDSVNSVAFSPNGQQLASCSFDCTVRLWDAARAACLQTFEGHMASVNSVVFSPSGQKLASCSDDRTVRLWDAAMGACLGLQTLKGHIASVNSVVFSPSGQQLASCSGDHTVRLWDAVTGACLQTLKGYTDSIVFNPSGSNLFTDFGVFSVGQIKSNIVSKRSGLSIRSEKWITLNDHNILWLPTEYRAQKSVAKENRIGVGCSSGLIYILNFHLESFPN